jgi:hypothetical protein
MERHQAIQNRAAQTAAVIKQYDPLMKIGAVNVSGLLASSHQLGVLAQARDDALAAFVAADNIKNQGFLALVALTKTLPRMAQADLDENVDAEVALLDMLDPVFAIVPRGTEHAIMRGQKLVAALNRINDYLSSLTPPRGPVTSAGQGVIELGAAIDAQGVASQARIDRAADITAARSALRNAATTVDKLNKRFYSKLKAEARSNATLATALGQIDTSSANLPPTLSIHTLRQGGAQNRQLLVSYVNGSFDNDATNSVEWKIDDEQAFAHTVAADPSGNTIGPFDSGATVFLRTRVATGAGTKTGSVRKLTII